MSLLIGLSACATADKGLSSTLADGVDFSRFSHYRWLHDGGDSINNLSIFDNQILRNRMHRAIDKSLMSRGLQYQENETELSFQLVVRNRGQIQTQTNTNAQYPYGYSRYPYGTTTSTSTPTFFQHREVLISCFDAKGNLLWNASLIKDYKTAPDLQKNIEADMAQLMSRFPVKAKTARP